MRTTVPVLALAAAILLAGCAENRADPEAVDLSIIIGSAEEVTRWESLPVQLERLVFEDLDTGEEVVAHVSRTVDLAVPRTAVAWPAGKIGVGSYAPVRAEFGLSELRVVPKEGLPFHAPSTSARMSGDSFVVNGTAPVVLRLAAFTKAVTERDGIPLVRFLGVGAGPVVAPVPEEPTPDKKEDRGVGTLVLHVASASGNNTNIANYSSLVVRLVSVRYEDQKGTVTRPVNQTVDLVALAATDGRPVHRMNLSGGFWKSTTLFIELVEAVEIDGSPGNVSIAPDGRYTVGEPTRSKGPIVIPDRESVFRFTFGAWMTPETGNIIMSRPDLSGPE